MSALPKKQDKSHLSVAIIRTAPENDLIYDKFGIANAAGNGLSVVESTPKDDKAIAEIKKLADIAFMPLK